MKLRRATLADLDPLADLEARSYPDDEAASRETLAYRIENAPACFWLAEDPQGALIGFVCGTLGRDDHLSEASLKEHHPDGSSLCIHSVVIDPDRRRSGLGLRLVAAYLERTTAALPQVERFLLMCKQHLQDFYARNGFQLLGPSAVVHGQDPWFDMRRPRTANEENRSS